MALTESLDPTPEDMKKAMNEGLEEVYQNVLNNTPEGNAKTHELKANTKKSVTIKDMQVIGKITANKFYAGFLEFGTKYSKAHLGYFSNAAHAKEDNAVNIMADSLLSKAK